MTTCCTYLFCWEFFRHTPYYGRTTIGLQPLTIHLQQPGPGHGRERPEQGAKRTQGIRVHVAAKRHEHTEIGGRGRRRGAAPPTTSTSSLPTLPRLKPDRALPCFLG